MCDTSWWTLPLDYLYFIILLLSFFHFTLTYIFATGILFFNLYSSTEQHSDDTLQAYFLYIFAICALFPNEICIVNLIYAQWKICSQVRWIIQKRKNFLRIPKCTWLKKSLKANLQHEFFICTTFISCGYPEKKFHSKINRQLHKRLVFVQLLYREKLIASIQLAKIYSFGKIEVNRLTQQTRGAMQHIYFILIQCDIHTYTQSSARASVFRALLCSDKLFMHYLINDLNQPN